MMGTKFRFGGSHEIITDESFCEVILSSSGEPGTKT